MNRIVPIFDKKLFAFHYDDQPDNELNRLLVLWNDPEYIDSFIEKNKADIPKHEDLFDLSMAIIDNAFDIDCRLEEIANSDELRLEDFFKPLNNQEYREVDLSRQKGRKNYLRIYAIRIDTNCFVITGGAIKFHHLMEKRDHTNKELLKINRCKDFLIENGVFDSDSFHEYLNEEL